MAKQTPGHIVDSCPIFRPPPHPPTVPWNERPLTPLQSTGSYATCTTPPPPTILISSAARRPCLRWTEESFSYTYELQFWSWSVQATCRRESKLNLCRYDNIRGKIKNKIRQNETRTTRRLTFSTPESTFHRVSGLRIEGNLVPSAIRASKPWCADGTGNEVESKVDARPRSQTCAEEKSSGVENPDGRLTHKLCKPALMGGNRCTLELAQQYPVERTHWKEG